MSDNNACWRPLINPAGATAVNTRRGRKSIMPHRSWKGRSSKRALGRARLERRTRSGSPNNAPSHSTHWHEGNAFTAVVSGDALGARVERKFSIHQKSVSMMAMLQRRTSHPRFVRHLFHRICVRLPIVKIPHQTDRVRVRCVTDEIDRPQCWCGSVTIKAHEKNTTF